MTAAKSPTAPPGLVDGELVDDRSLAAFEADSFGHEDFVRELGDLVCMAETPASIALFGPWGSGKSSIANLLEQVLPRDRAQARFVVFDASKYAEAPLRRHFISQVAYRLDIRDDKYHRGLYTGEETQDIRFRPGEWAKLAFWFLVTTALTLAILLVIATCVAALSAGAFKSNWSSIVKDYLLLTLPVAAVITTFVKLAADGFHVTRTRSAPSGDEEFEALFKQLVADAKTKRVVVFIDELDRCSPRQVASTLETLKTFLFVDGCVFVVAADQQVLEQALRREVRQHTPEDASNPYYSAGSSYLDKVFQYQLALPPLRAPTLSRYALKLVRRRPGVWQRIPALDEAMSVLIPTHVVSPRRVKVLLNRYGATYRLAERRAAEGRLDRDFGERATELAKLVCLQAEFPLFAEDLTLDARLPELVRLVADSAELPPHVQPEVLERATEYATGRRRVAELLIDGERPERAVDDEGDGQGDDTRAEDVVRQHAQQLVSYLRKTKHVAGPGPDLLYLESAGADHGIDMVLADRLQRAAFDNETDEVLALVASAAGDGEGRGALLVLADVVRLARPGVEGRNVVTALLQSIQRSGVTLDHDADSIADAVASHLVEADLDADDLLGALALAGASSRDVGPRLLLAVLIHPAATRRPDVSVALLRHAQDVPRSWRANLGIVVSAALLRAPAADVAAALTDLPPDAARAALADATAAVKRTSDAHYAATKAQAAGEEADESAILETPPDDALAAIHDAVDAAARALRVELIRLMLALGQQDLRSAVRPRLAGLAPIADAPLINAVFRAARIRVIRDWPAWLEPLSAEAIGRDEAAQEWVDALARHLWSTLDGDDPPTEEQADQTLAALRRCAAHMTIAGELRDLVRPALDKAFTTDDEVASMRTLVQRARRFVEAGLLADDVLADAMLSAVVWTLNAAVGDTPAEQRTEVEPQLVAIVQDAAPRADEDVLRSALDVASNSTWVTAAARANVRMTLAAALLRVDDSTPSPLTADELHALVGEAGSGELEDDTLAVWLDRFAGSAVDAWTAIEPLAGGQLPAGTSDALSRFSQRLSGPARFELIDHALGRTLTAPVDPSFFEAARLSEVPARRVVERLVQLFVEAQDETGWRAVLKLWQQLAPASDADRRRLVDMVYLPLVAKGDAGLDLAISYFGLVAAVRGIRDRVMNALKEAATTEEQQERVDDRLREANWRKRSMFGLGPVVDQKEPEA